MKVSQRVSELETQTAGLKLVWSQFTKGHNSVKMVNSYGTSSDVALYFEFQENISKGFRIIERLPFVYCNFQRVIIL